MWGAHVVTVTGSEKMCAVQNIHQIQSDFIETYLLMWKNCIASSWFKMVFKMRLRWTAVVPMENNNYRKHNTWVIRAPITTWLKGSKLSGANEMLLCKEQVVKITNFVVTSIPQNFYLLLFRSYPCFLLSECCKRISVHVLCVFWLTSYLFFFHQLLMAF